MLLFRIFCCLLFLTGLTHSYSQQPVLYSGEREIKIGFDAITYLGTADSVTTASQAKTYFEQGRFAVNKLPDLNLGIARDNYWVAFKINNATAQHHELYINLENPRLNEVEVFVVRNDSILTPLTLGDNFPFFDRPVEYRQFTFPVPLRADQTTLIPALNQT